MKNEMKKKKYLKDWTLNLLTFCISYLLWKTQQTIIFSIQYTIKMIFVLKKKARKKENTIVSYLVS